MTCRQRDLSAGGLCLALGAATTAEAWRYPLGTMRELGPGLFPLALGVLLSCVGMLIAGSALSGSSHPGTTATLGMEGTGNAHLRPEWAGWFCIVAGMALFIAIARPAGLVVAGFISTFVWAVGDRQATWRGAFVLAAVIATFGALLFGVLLGVNLPLWPTGWGS